MTNLEYMICEAEANGEISINTRDEMLSVITEKKTKAEYRKQKFLKKYEYDKKTGTIKMDGVRTKFYDMKGSNKRNADPNACVVSSTNKQWRRNKREYKQIISDIEKEISDMKKELNDSDSSSHKDYLKSEIKKKEKDMRYLKEYLNTGQNGIHMNTASFNMKNPKSHEFIANHERGHLEVYRQNRKENAPSKQLTVMKLEDEDKELLKETLRYYKQAQKNPDSVDKHKIEELKKRCDKMLQKNGITSDEKEKYRRLKDKIEDMIYKNKYSGKIKDDSHAANRDEYMADYYASTHTKDGKKVAKKTLDEVDKRFRKNSDEQLANQSHEGSKLNEKLKRLRDNTSDAKKKRKSSSKSFNASKRSSKDAEIYSKEMKKRLDKAHEDYMNYLDDDSEKKFKVKDGKITKTDLHKIRQDNIKFTEDIYDKAMKREFDRKIQNLSDELDLNNARRSLREAKLDKNRTENEIKNIANDAKKDGTNEINLRKKSIDRLSKDKDADILKKK